jgi:hypothetical protein
MQANDVYAMRPDKYEKWPFKGFQRNLKNLREVIAKSYARMQTDCEAYGHDRALLKTLQVADPHNIPWHKSEAKQFLKLDIDDGKHLQMKPAKLHLTRMAYRKFDLKVFRKHIYQEVDSRAKRAVRFAKKKTRAPAIGSGST